ncbi:MAG: lactate dehydrogenase [Lentisphaeria bacterium]|nr:lactate dehydrogenase [Lentisphaeria bacterium]
MEPSGSSRTGSGGGATFSAPSPFPVVEAVEMEQLFDCDVFIFCASKGVPPVGAEGAAGGREGGPLDVRMVQLAGNRPIVEHYASEAVKRGFRGLFAVVSDPVDPLCKAALLQGLRPEQIRGFGLGVMNARAAYFARKDSRFVSYLTEGRAFGPHGGDLVIANSIFNYDDGLSQQLTELTVGANLKMRELGFKPYIAPALSSGALSLLALLRGHWHYSSFYLGPEQDIREGVSLGQEAWKGAFLGAANRFSGRGTEVENLPLPEALYERIETAYRNLCGIEY